MEEQQCLVRGHSDSEGSLKLTTFGAVHREMALSNSSDGGGDPVNTQPQRRHSADELLDYSDCSVLELFHEDAITQAGCGVRQALVTLACWLALCGAALEHRAVPFVLPSAEIELCILPHEKNWLVIITLLGWSVGALCGSMMGRVGRRRSLRHCLSVSAVFAPVAAVMPTYGTFMMARFCSAIGSGGLIPACYTYTSELWPRNKRRIPLAVLLSANGAGALMAAGLASAVLPAGGEEALKDHKDHFSAWHRYLLICTIPTLASLVSLIWTVESPRFLLDIGREVDAMLVYQSIHTSNQNRLCGALSTNDEPRLTELALPGKRRVQGNQVSHGVKMFWQAFFQLFSNTYRSTTLSLGGILLLALSLQYYLASYVPAKVQKIENELFEASKLKIFNRTFENEYYNKTLQNVEYNATEFRSSTFRDLLMLHVVFRNCSFNNMTFANVRTSHCQFFGCQFYNSTIIDSDITPGIELDPHTTLHNTPILGMNAGCGRLYDLSGRLDTIVKQQSWLAYAALAATISQAKPASRKMTVILSTACIVLSPFIYLAQSETPLYIIQSLYEAFLTLIVFIACVKIIESYPANMRCLSLGLLLSLSYASCATIRGIGEFGTIATCVIASFLSVTITAVAVKYRH